jgi:hypothetical protein
MKKIKRTNSNFVREPLLAPFGFKGGYLDELWQKGAYTQICLKAKGVGIIEERRKPERTGKKLKKA